ncbi:MULTISPECIES: glycosyltransferase family 1 protein [unclassified Nocardioides]|uniref:rhamnosyltransferase WsaF family glycosyltransferase n=1 Tax=unclassified Nocardioides TaxID=2615069 RepID=UPI00188612E8|nr:MULTISPECIES: glycosyltransferase family 1 protein [unclassified Nocardioides]
MRRADRAAHLVRRLRAEGPQDSARRAARWLHHRVGADALDFGLREDEIADSTRLVTPTARCRADDGPLTVGWLCSPPAAGSGGHTTMFRMVRAFEAAGHRCVLLLHDRHGGRVEQQARVIREGWPWVGAEVRSVADGLGGLDACVATGWETAHVLAARCREPLHRFYFIQDFEPFFYPRGSEHELATDTYRFGFTHLALGHMVQDRLLTEVGVGSLRVPFSCDTSTYSLTRDSGRTGVVLYAKPGVPRRGFRLAVLALREFHARHPEQEIHTYGAVVPDLGVPATQHGGLTPAELAALYNRCLAGLAPSFTNISLVAEEMLASGCVPVVNDAPDARADLASPAVAWAVPTPGGLADALSRVVSAADPAAQARAAAASVRRDDWALTGAGVVRAVVDQVRGVTVAAPAPPTAGTRPADLDPADLDPAAEASRELMHGKAT